MRHQALGMSPCNWNLKSKMNINEVGRVADLSFNTNPL